MTIESGQRIALVGQPGSGKSTLSKIPSRLYKIDTGKVLFYGININQIDKKILSQNLGVVPQDSFLLNRSILDNITLKHEVTSQKIEEVCKAVQIYDEIMAMPMKFNTIISEMGSNISGGQRQRIALARALINNPSIVILDEATSALDTINEERITKYIQSQGCTQIIIAHRLSTIKNADIIFVMKGGKIVESGNHKYLMILGGEYYSLYTKRKWGVKKMKKENEYVILTTASLGVMIGIVFAIFLDFPVEYGISLGLLNGIVLGSLIVYKNNKN